MKMLYKIWPQYEWQQQQAKAEEQTNMPHKAWWGGKKNVKKDGDFTCDTGRANPAMNHGGKGREAYKIKYG